MKTILYLSLRQFVNYMKLTLRSPRRLIAAVFIFFWFVSAILPQIMISREGHYPAAQIYYPGMTLDKVWASAFMLFTLIAIWFIQKSFSESLIAFALSDIDFSFPTPLSRRVIMFSKLVKLYATIGGYLALALLFTWPFAKMLAESVGRRGSSLLVTWSAIVAFAVVLINACTIINLIVNYRSDGRWWLRSAVKAVAWAIPMLAIAFTAAGYLQTGNLAESLIGAIKHPIFLTLMMPMKWTADIALSPFTGWRAGMAGEYLALGLLTAVSFVLVLLRNENPYEPSLSVSARRAVIKAAVRSGGIGRVTAELWKLRKKPATVRGGIPPFGRGAVAVIWKNLNILVRGSLKGYLYLLLIGMAAFIGMHILTKSLSADDVQRFVLIGLMYIIIMMSSMMLQKLRSDIQQANTLKPIPIPAWQLVAAETIEGTALISFLAWTWIALTAIVFGLTPRSPLPLIAVLMPFLANAVISAQAVVAIVYPNWDDFGQRYIGGLLSMFAAMLTGGFLIGIGSVMWHFRVSALFIIPIFVFFALAISMIGVLLGGYIYRHSDPTNE